MYNLFGLIHLVQMFLFFSLTFLETTMHTLNYTYIQYCSYTGQHIVCLHSSLYISLYFYIFLRYFFHSGHICFQLPLVLSKELMCTIICTCMHTYSLRSKFHFLPSRKSYYLLGTVVRTKTSLLSQLSIHTTTQTINSWTASGKERESRRHGKRERDNFLLLSNFSHVSCPHLKSTSL